MLSAPAGVPQVNSDPSNMGSVYRRSTTRYVTCRRRLTRAADRGACSLPRGTPRPPAVDGSANRPAPQEESAQRRGRPRWESISPTEALIPTWLGRVVGHYGPRGPRDIRGEAMGEQRASAVSRAHARRLARLRDRAVRKLAEAARALEALTGDIQELHLLHELKAEVEQYPPPPDFKLRRAKPGRPWDARRRAR